MASRREEMIAYLRNARRTPKELAALMRMSVRDALTHLEHVQKSVGSDFNIVPAQCRSCDFVFGSRTRINTPSRCPECRAERIAGPWLYIET